MSEYQTEVQRLRAALHKITQIYDDPNLHDLTACREMHRVAKEALSTATEPTGQNDADDLIGDWIDERCPKCGADLLANKVGDKWCSLVGCDYSINAKERVGTEEWRHKYINAYWAREGLIKHQEAEIQRLRAENERYRKALERIAETDIPYAPMTDHSVMRFYEQVAREALASTQTEPSGAELVKCVICKTVAYPNGRWKKAHYGDVCPDCRSGRRIKIPEQVGTEEWRHKYFGAEWPKVEGDGNDV